MPKKSTLLFSETQKRKLYDATKVLVDVADAQFKRAMGEIAKVASKYARRGFKK